MALFTVVLQAGGGTYVKQVRARTAQAAFQSWLRSLGAGAKHPPQAARVAKAFAGAELAPAGTLTGVWAAGALLSDRPLLVQVIATADGG